MTKESFLEWRKKFEAEMNEKLGCKDTLTAGQPIRLTGILVYDSNIIVFILH